jgi:hypothetical protein
LFVNRRAELDLLEKRFASGKAEYFVLYGRRRVGKTELLARFCEGKRSIFFVSDLGAESSPRNALPGALIRSCLAPTKSTTACFSRRLLTVRSLANLVCLPAI